MIAMMLLILTLIGCTGEVLTAEEKKRFAKGMCPQITDLPDNAEVIVAAKGRRQKMKVIELCKEHR